MNGSRYQSAHRSLSVISTGASDLVEGHGPKWVRGGPTRGKYRQGDACISVGGRVEESGRVLERLVVVWLASAESVLAFHLHTGQTHPPP